ncbi:glucosylceramide transporter ABCA12 [Syngnathus typhle]|uniref:glucosylceramide transporter ABCA12 n=1 Tax=Syngnathus typhle TaxID=161592 RepID=UPI002A6B34FA|nr:glucosylceramide transporter ABCA12 [Syngnathus typhle]
MGFFQQVKLLLWKNGLNIIRNPVWSVTLIIWPLIIFIIVAVTRDYYPPQLREPCYVSPRNLPSTGFFPFLQTVMCNSDSRCRNMSRLVTPSKLTKRSTHNTRSSATGSLLAKMIQGGDFYTFPNDSSLDLPLFNLKEILMAADRKKHNGTATHTNNSTFISNQDAVHKMMEAINLLKRPICAISLTALNASSPGPISNATINFCNSNSTVFEVFLRILNQLLKEEMLTQPDQLAKVFGAVMLVFEEMQNESSLWESLLAIPELYSAGSLEQMLDTSAVLLTNIQGIQHVIQSNFPETAESIFGLHPLIAGGIDIIRYAQKWPGNDVSISLGDIVILNNDSVSIMAEPVLRAIRIPLTQVLFLTLDGDILEDYICDNSSNPLWLTAMCMSGAVDMILDYISPGKVAQQALLAWSKHVASHDVSFFKGLLHNLTGSNGGSNISRPWHKIDTQPRKIEEELFLTVGEVLLKLSEIHPDVDMIVQQTLGVGFKSMEIASLSIATVEEMMDNTLKDSARLQNIYQTLLTNQSEASVWISQILNSVTQVIMKSLASPNVTCEDALGPFQWLLSTETIKFEVWKSIICENSITLENLLLVEWMPLIEKGEELYNVLRDEEKDFNVTLSMILSEWHRLYNSSLEFGAFLHRLSSELGPDYALNWLPGNSSDITETLLQSVFVFMVNLGEKIEKSPQWPEMKSYFIMVSWVFNYVNYGATIQPANCSLDMDTLNIYCDAHLSWDTFVEGLFGVIMLPSQDLLVNYLKATVTLLQNVYGDLVENMTASYLTQEIKGGDALSAYLINLMNKLDNFTRTVTTLSDENIVDPEVMVPIVSELFECTGLSPLLPLLFGNGSVNASSIIDAAVKLGRGNQHIFTFNETDPTMPELEWLIMQFLSSEGNLTMSLSYVMGNTLLTYSNYFDREKVVHVQDALKPFTNQTSSGIVEGILSAMELLKEVVDSPNGDPSNLILSYIHQLQECIASLLKLRRIQQTLLPNGQLTTAEVTDLHQVSTDLINLLTPESLDNLTQIGPEAALDLVIERILPFLPPEFQEPADLYYQDFKALQYHLSLCASEQNCSSGISEFFTFLDEIVNLTLSADANVTINITNKFLESGEYLYEDVTSAFFSLMLSPNDTVYVNAFNQTLQFIQLVIAMPIITIPHIQDALRQSNLTLEELNYISHLAGADNVNELSVNIMEIANVPKCFELQHNASVTAQCVMGLIDKASNFLANIPALQNHTTIISLVPLIVNKTTSELIQVNFTSNAQMPIIHVLNDTLNNIKMNLQMNNLSTPEILKEIQVMEGLLKVAANPEPLNLILEAMSVPYSEEVTIAYLQIMQWYLQRLENVTSTSFVSELLHPFYRLTQLQVTLQIAHTNLTLFINNQVDHFQDPADGADVRKIGQATVAILQQILNYIIVNIQVQDENFQIFSSVPFINSTMLHEIEQQIQLYLELIHDWMEEPNVTAVFNSMLHWGNASINASTPVKDLHLLLQSMVSYLSVEQRAYLTIISNITRSLSKAIMVLEHPGELQFDHLFAAIMEAVQSFLQVLTQDTAPLSQSAQENIQEIIRNTVVLFVEQNLTFSTSLNLTLDILNRTEMAVQQLVPEEFAVYLLPVLKVFTNYFETITVASGPDNWNIIILNQLKMIRSFLPPNSTAQYYVSVAINITNVILDSSQGNVSLENQITQILEPIMEAVQSFLQILTQDTTLLPQSAQENIQEIIHKTVVLFVEQNLTFSTSLNLTLDILNRTEMAVQQLVPEEFAVYMLPVLKILTNYFETITVASGPDNWNIIILNQLKTIRSFLPPNSTAQYYVSVAINITNVILDSSQGNSSLENQTTQILMGIFNQIWQIFTNGPGLNMSPSVETLSHLGSVLQQILTGQADQETWHMLKKMLGIVLTTISETQQWDNVTAVIPYFEKIIACMVNTQRAQKMMLVSLAKPVLTLMREIVQSANGSYLNLSEISERIQPAIQQTLLAAEQANGTLECDEAVKPWEPIRVAANLSNGVIEMWCNISLQPVLEIYADSHYICPHLNTSHMDSETITAGDAAARIVNATKSLYQASRNTSHVMEQIIMNVSSQFSELLGQPLSHSAQLHWYMQLQNMQLQNSLSAVEVLSDELLQVAPMLEPCVDALEEALRHILNNYHLNYDTNSSEVVFTEAAAIVLSCANITLNNIFSMVEGDLSGFSDGSFLDMISDAIEAMTNMKVFGDEAMVYQGLGRFLASNGAKALMQKVVELSSLLATSNESGLDLLTQTLPKISQLFRALLSTLTQMGVDMPEIVDVFEEFAENIFAMLRQLLSSGLLGHHPLRGSRHKRDAPMMPPMMPLMDIANDFRDFLSIDYLAMFRSMAVPSPEEIMETAHMFFSNPDLKTIVKQSTRNMAWASNGSHDKTINAALGVLSFATLPSHTLMSSLALLRDAAEMLPESFPFSALLKNMTRALANESQGNLMDLQQVFRTASHLSQTNMSDPLFAEQLDQLRSQVCRVETTKFARSFLDALFMEPGHLCYTLLPGLQVLLEGVLVNTTDLHDAIFQTLVGDPSTYNDDIDWPSVLSQGFGFDISRLSSLNINFTSQEDMTFGEMLRNKSAFVHDVQKHLNVNPHALQMLTETVFPTNNLQILSWLMKLRHCNSPRHLTITEPETVLFQTFCSMSGEDWYTFAVLMSRHIRMEKFLFRMVLSDELQSLLGLMIQVASNIIGMMDQIIPAIDQLQSYILSMEELHLIANTEFSEVTRRLRSRLSNKATFVTMTRAMCKYGIMPIFGLAKLSTNINSSSLDSSEREKLIDRFKIPQNATPYCMNMYLDMVNTTGGAIAWAFLKPMLMGKILFTPDTPITRTIMEKANTTLEEFSNLQRHSDDWIKASKYIVKSSEMLRQTLPLLKNSLANAFVRNFIEVQTDIDVMRMKETLNNFSNMTILLEKNKHIMDQITTLSTLMVNISSCIKFDRYQGYQSAEQLDAEAQELAKDRSLYGSVIFKLPKENDSSPLPPKVSYTIRMHLDNVMRTDRVRSPYFVKDHHISSSRTMRYNRAFVYLQENIDRAIIEMQTGRVTDTAVQLQPFPYPCYLRDQYLEAISLVFPIMLMLAWVLFVADFVKKLVHERELGLHEYMKMMGVNPLSHFLAWFLECAAHLIVTIIILTIILKHGGILSHSDGFLLFLYFCDYGLTILAFSFLISSFFDKTYIAGLSGSLIYIICFFPFIVVMALESSLNIFQKSALSLFSPTCFSYASQYIALYEAREEGIQWSNSYSSPLSGDTASFGWLCWMMLFDSLIYFTAGVYIRMVFPGKFGIPAPWYFPFTASFWADLFCCVKSQKGGRGHLFANTMKINLPVFSDDKRKGQSQLFSQTGEDFSHLPVGVNLHGLTKIYGDRVAIQNLNLSFYEGHVTSLLGHNGAGKTTTMSLLTGLFPQSSGSIEVYGRDMQTNLNDVRKDLGVCMQYDVLFDHMTAKEHLLLYGQIKAPHWSERELHEQVRTTLEETDMYAHRHKRVGALSGGMKRKLSISIAFIGGSRLVVLDEPTTGVDPCSRRSIWDIVIQNKKRHTIIMSTHHLDEAEMLSDRIAFLERGGLKCCGSPFYLKDKLGQGYKLTLTKKVQIDESERFDDAEMKAFIHAHVPEARLKEAQGNDLIYSLPPFTSTTASSYSSLLSALDINLDDLQLGGYGISDTTLEEVFLQLTEENIESASKEDRPFSISDTVSDTSSIDSFPADPTDIFSTSDKTNLTHSSRRARGIVLAWQQIKAILIKRFHHSRRDYKGLLSKILLPVLFVTLAMGLGSIKNDLGHYPELELSPALYNLKPSYSFFSNQNSKSSRLVDTMMSYPGMDNSCLDHANNQDCKSQTHSWNDGRNASNSFRDCKCTNEGQVCDGERFNSASRQIPSSQIVYNLSGINVENYLLSTANGFIRNRYGGFEFGMPFPRDLQNDIRAMSDNATLSKVWFNPEGYHTIPAYLNSLNNVILRSKLPADKDPKKYAISVSSHPYFGRADEDDSITLGMLQILVALCVITGYSITTASFAIYVVKEHHSGSKRLQHIAGINEPFYWTINFLYDMIIYLIPVTLTIVVIAAFQVPAFTDRQNLDAVALLLVLFGFATFPWMYLLSGVFKDAETAFIIYVCINLFISINTIMSTSIVFFLAQSTTNTVEKENIQNIFTTLSDAFLIFPQFNFGNGLMKLARMNVEVQLLSGYAIDAYKNPFSTEALGWMFISSIIQGSVFFALRLLLNTFLMRNVRHLILGRKKVSQMVEDEDEDVAAERLRVSSGAAGADILQVNQLTKIYQNLNKKSYAVKRLSVGIPAGECFGLLGVNGAGKTTTFKMLTGDVSPTDGTAQIRDWDGRLVDIMECRRKGINIGYCPQVDALDNLLTGEEHLYFYARIQGISKRQIDRVVNYLLKRLELNYHRNIITDGYSCGTRRKLSTAIALIGHPQILLLDEPSSGMDPRTKRHLWKIISEEVKGKSAVVLTSHSMEECEALCSRLAIMVKGQFRCLGSMQHIKNRFGRGFTVKMYLAESAGDVEAITVFMQRRFPSTYLKDQHSSMAEYHIPVAPGGVADIFQHLERNKTSLKIKHFSVSQTTLDEVFINFAMGNFHMKSISTHSNGEKEVET